MATGYESEVISGPDKLTNHYVLCSDIRHTCASHLTSSCKQTFVTRRPFFLRRFKKLCLRTANLVERTKSPHDKDLLRVLKLSWHAWQAFEWKGERANFKRRLRTPPFLTSFNPRHSQVNSS